MFKMTLLRLLSCMVLGGLPNVAFEVLCKLRDIFQRTVRNTTDPPGDSRIFATSVPKLLKILYVVTYPCKKRNDLGKQKHPVMTPYPQGARKFSK